MALLPFSEEALIDRYGPHLNYEPVGGWQSSGTPDRLVQTHCCFCGVQCGIQLKVRDEKVVGFEPWHGLSGQSGKALP